MIGLWAWAATAALVATILIGCGGEEGHWREAGAVSFGDGTHSNCLHQVSSASDMGLAIACDAIRYASENSSIEQNRFAIRVLYGFFEFFRPVNPYQPLGQGLFRKEHHSQLSRAISKVG